MLEIARDAHWMLESEPVVPGKVPVNAFKSVTQNGEVIVTRAVGRKKLQIWGKIFKVVMKFVDV